jgi:ATP-dependent DNA helicase
MNNPVMQLRKIVNHPYLVRWDVNPETGDYVVNDEMITDSGKLTVLDQMLTRLIKDGHRVSSVFCFKSSQFVNHFIFDW